MTWRRSAGVGNHTSVLFRTSEVLGSLIENSLWIKFCCLFAFELN